MPATLPCLLGPDALSLYGMLRPGAQDEEIKSIKPAFTKFSQQLGKL